MLIEVEVWRLSGPFRSTEAIAEAIAQEVWTLSEIEVDGSVYEYITASWYGPVPKEKKERSKR